MGHSGDALSHTQAGDHWGCRGRVSWSLGEVFSSSRGLQSHAAIWGRFSNTEPSKVHLKAPLGPAQPPNNCPLPSPEPTASPGVLPLCPITPTTAEFSVLCRPCHWEKHGWLGGTRPPTFQLQGCRGVCSPPASSIINFHQWPSGAGAAWGWPRNTALSPDSKNKYIKILAGGRRMRDGRKKLFYNL